MDREVIRQFKCLLHAAKPHERPAIVKMIRQRAFKMAFHAFQVELNQCIGVLFDDSTSAKLEAIRTIVEERK